MSILQADGIEFGNGTVLNTFYGIIPQNSTMVFYQASAPTGWTQDATENDKALRVVDGSSGFQGGSSSGLLSFTSIFNDSPGGEGTCTAFTEGTIDETTLTEAQIPAHTHNTGSNPNSYRSSASSSPFRSDNRQPRGYAIRGESRIIFNNRVIVNFRQPVNVRQPRNYRQEQRQRVPLRNRQPRDFRVRYDARSRNPVPFRAPVPFRVPLRWRNPISYRRDDGRWRRPIQQQFRSSWRNNDRFPRRRGGRRRRNDREPRRVDRRGTNWWNWRQRRQIRRPRSFRQRRSFRQPNNFRQPRNFRQRRQFRVRQPRTFRVRYEFRQRNAYRVNIPFRVTVPQRNPASYRQPRAYRVVQRYPLVSNVRVSQRTLSPGGTIRSSNTQAPATSSTGGGQGHTHPFTADEVTFITFLSPLRVQYVDVILCSLD